MLHQRNQEGSRDRSTCILLYPSYYLRIFNQPIEFICPAPPCGGSSQRKVLHGRGDGERQRSADVRTVASNTMMRRSHELGEEARMRGCRALSDDEVALVSKSFSGTYAARDKALFVLGVKSGFRISELLSLTVGDVWQHGQFVERVAVQRRHMKGKTQGRSVILHPEAKGALARWLMTLQCGGTVTPDTCLFPS